MRAKDETARIAGETVTDDQLRWLRDNTGWVGEAREKEHRIIGNALRGDPVARGLCAGILNERARIDPLLAAFLERSAR